ncbi:MAG: T9SS type A sorting domain-containing protein [Candidatus Cloacimonadales bacterium]|nr:T9SS type A sorting domain-containing protein [Candidatus Cloacimonadales bacterium]
MLKMNETARHTLKKTILIFFLLFITTLAFADTSITRGPAVGEIYYIGPTVTGQGIYHSTDFGETATCMDSTLNTNIPFMNINADLTPGVIYGTTMGEALYISYDYGQQGSWNLRNSGITYIHSGRNEGQIYKTITRHSEDYGNTFINHSYNGYFGSFKTSEIDNEDNVGYALVYEYGNTDTLWLLISYDEFENLEIQHVFDGSFLGYYISLTRGFDDGELYLNIYHLQYGKMLYYSNDYGISWEFKSYPMGCTIVGGRQPGELYMLVGYSQLMGEIKHTYIYHSMDYGETFEIYHPFSYGSEPYYANFAATPLEGNAPLTVQFTDTSSGDYLEGWEWDFQNDGVIDSYEQNPQYTYQDTGYYSVKLKIFYGTLEDGFMKNNYIHVTSGNGIDNEELPVPNCELSNYPNPFNPSTMILFNLPEDFSGQADLSIYNLKGQKIKTLSNLQITQSPDHQIVWNGTDQTGQPVSSGIYFYKLSLEHSPIKKMILMK